MKKIFVLALICFIVMLNIFFCFRTQNIVLADLTYYGKIENLDVAIYSNVDENEKIFILPASYFVELLSNANEQFYYARYNDLYGYVKKSEVTPIKGIPTSPFLTNITFRVFVPSGANLRSSPYNNGAANLVYSVPFLDSNFSYYGTIEGEEAISHKGNTWYYCKYFSANIAYAGYIYSPLCDMLSPISNNTEEYEVLDGELKFENEIELTSTNAIEKLSTTAQTLIIIAISLPCLLFIYLLFKPTLLAESKSTSKTSSKSKSKKKKIKRLKHSDYYEFNNDDFE